jgi:hypothetical protein
MENIAAHQGIPFFNKMQCLSPEMATGLGPLWAQLGASPLAPSGMPNAVAAMTAQAQHNELTEIKARLGVLVELAARQAEQQEAMRKQLEEQAQYMASTMQAVRHVQTQVTATRTDFIDVFRTSGIAGGFAGHHAFDRESQVRRNIEARRGDSAVSRRDDGECQARRADPVASRRDGEMPGSKSAQPGVTESPEFLTRTLLDDAALSPPHGSAVTDAAGCGSSASSRKSSGGACSTHCLEEEAPQARSPSTFGFNRSPPGLSLYPEEAKEEAWISEVACEMKNLIIADDGRCVDVIEQAKPQVLNKTDHDGMTVFHYAAMHGRAKACDAILRHSGFAATKVGDRNSNTALHIAALHDQGDVCHAIIRQDASTASVVNRFGDTPSDIAQRRGDTWVCDAFQIVQLG